MNTTSRRARATPASPLPALGSVCCLLSIAALAGAQAPAPVPQPPQPPGVAAPPSDPPGRVGRLTAIDGAVSFRAAADTEWGFASPNQPTSTGDRVWSDSNGRAVIEAGDVTMRVWHQTELDIVRLDDNTVQLAIPQGTAALRIAALPSGDMAEIDAPNAVVTPTATGEYRVDVSADGATTTVTVWSGSADVTSGGSSFALQGHQVATIHGDSGAAPTYDVSQAHSPDDFDQWSTDLDNRANRALAEHQYVPSSMPGWEDLDDNGTWDYDDDDGPVWYPSQIAVGWVPYRFGHWVWFGVWGWTWVDDAPWGWAPFHYGRWAYIHDRWGWCPGRVIATPVFAPALVVFVGGPTWAPGGGYGWFPLAPGEVYRPAYVVSTPYIRRLNITTVTNITNVTNVTNITVVNYRNRGVADAVTVVSRNTFVSAAPVGGAIVRVPPDEITRASIVAGALPITPTRESIMSRPGGRPIVVPPVSIRQRSVVALHAPPPAPVPLSAQLRTISSNAGRPLTSQQLTSLRLGAPSAPARPVRSVAAPTMPHLTAARSGLPATRPALATGVVSHPVAMPPVRPTSGPPATAVPGGLTAATPPPVVTRPTERVGSPSLTASYAAERNAQEARHVQEFANPPAGESQAALSARQESEDQALESRYHSAAASGAATMPARPASPPARGGTVKTRG